MATNTNSLTNAILKYGNAMGYVLWRNNNGAVYSARRQRYLKNPNHKLGVPDITGYREKDGKAVFIEIKSKRDKLSDYQKDFLAEAEKNGCIAFVATNVDEAVDKLEELSL